jgi:hypothetical protein
LLLKIYLIAGKSLEILYYNEVLKDMRECLKTEYIRQPAAKFLNLKHGKGSTTSKSSKRRRLEIIEIINILWN